MTDFTDLNNVAKGGNWGTNWSTLLTRLSTVSGNLEGSLAGAVAFVSGAWTPATGSVTLPLLLATSLPAAGYAIRSALNPTTVYGLAVLTVATSASASVTLSVQIAHGGSASDFFLVPLYSVNAAKNPSDSQTATYTLKKSDHDLVLRLAGTFALTIDSVANLGIGHRTRLVCDSGTITIGRTGSDTFGVAATALTLTAGQALSLEATDTARWDITGAVGYAGGWSWDAVQSGAGSYQAVKGHAIPCDATSNDVPILTPVSPAHGDEFRIRDAANNSGAAHFIILKYNSTDKIMRSTADHRLDVAGADFDKVYTYITGQGWL